MKDIENMTKAEQADAFQSSGLGAFKVLANLFGALKLLWYISYFVVSYLAYFGDTSWWWLLGCFGVSVVLEHLTKSSVHAHLMQQGYDYHGVKGGGKEG